MALPAIGCRWSTAAGTLTGVKRRIFGIEPRDPAVVEAWAEYVSDLLLFGIGSQKGGEG